MFCSRWLEVDHVSKIKSKPTLSASTTVFFAEQRFALPLVDLPNCLNVYKQACFPNTSNCSTDLLFECSQLLFANETNCFLSARTCCWCTSVFFAKDDLKPISSVSSAVQPPWTCLHPERAVLIPLALHCLLGYWDPVGGFKRARDHTSLPAKILLGVYAGANSALSRKHQFFELLA